MGMYTELVLGVKLLKKTPPKVIEALKFMTGDADEGQYEGNWCPDIDDPLFSLPRWRFMLRCGSYYFPGQPDSKLIEDTVVCIGEYWLNVRSNFKNYDGEINQFLKWLAPYVEQDGNSGFSGYYRYEESEEPTLIYFKSGAFKTRVIAEPEEA